MGVTPASDTLQRLVLPDTPPELASPSATTYSSRSSPAIEQAWGHRAPASFSMTNYDKPSAADMSSTASNPESSAQARTDAAGQSTSRQQLPSLSSLFGPSTSVRPLNSPMSDRPSPYPAQSPLDRPRHASSASGQHNSYFPPAPSPPVSQPRSTYEAKFEPLARSFSGSGSPRFREFNQSRPESRSEAEPATKWSIHQEFSKQEYSLGSRDASFQSPQDKFRHQFSASKDSTDYSEQRAAQSGANPPPTPTSTVPSEIVLSKDGLGPKIWTGSHFLPRFVRAAEVPGEGLCYFYDDGSHCKTVIDGEAVNAHWGVTKAGKPRKRLAIACVTCREKKIKCDPDYPRCVQCEKFGRICKFKNAPRGGHNTSPSASPAELEKMPAPSRSHEHRLSGSDCSSPVSPRDHFQPTTPDGGYNKRIKLGHEGFAQNGNSSTHSTHVLSHAKSQHGQQRAAPDMPRIPDDVLSRAWRTDPYSSDPQSINAVVAQFFVNIDSTMVLKFLPEEAFRTWLANSSHRKSSEDLMFLYSLLAVGVTLSGGPKHIAFEYAQVAFYAQKISTVNGLQLAQCRALLALYYISVGRLGESSELISSATAVAASMQLGVELERSREAGMSAFPFGMNRAGYSEARRRTLWSIFMLERLNGMFPDRPATINAEDIYVRIPSDTQSFEKQIDAHMPTFDPHKGSFARLLEHPFETTGYLVEMMHLWSNSQSAIYRLAHRPSSVDTEAGKLLEHSKRLQEWQSGLPSRLVFGSNNLESAAFNGNAGPFLTMHVLYHHAMIKLNRHSYVASRLPADTQHSYLQQCYDHATKIFGIVNSLDHLRRTRPSIMNTPPPALSAAITEALDVLTASGPMTYLGNLIDDVRIAKATIDSMTHTWEDSRGGMIAIDQRLQTLLRIRDQGSRPTTPIAGCRVFRSQDESPERAHLRWQIPEPIEKMYPRDMDIVYFTLA